LPEFSVFHVNGEQKSSERKQIIRWFRDASKALVTNARCLTEGIDVPAVDMVAFIDPRHSRVDIAQATGRAMRKPQGLNKEVGYVVIPLFLDRSSGETLEEALERTEFDDVADVLNAMQEQDEVLVQIIQEIQEAKGQEKVFDPQRLLEKIDILEPSIELSTLQSSICVEIVKEVGESWDEMFGRLLLYKEREGHCRVPSEHMENGCRLGRWVINQRSLATKSTLSTARKQRLDNVGFEWDPWETDWAEGLRYLTIYKEREGHCRVPALHKEKDNGYPLGSWVDRQRQSKETLSEARRRQLDGLGFVWDPREADWEEGIRYLTIYKEREGHCRVPFKHIENGFCLGQWVTSRRNYKRTLSKARRQQLDELGFVWDQLETDWEEGFRYLAIYKEREGHCRVPLEHMENGIGLGLWVRNQRSLATKGILSTARKQRLDDVGFEWDPRETDWAEGLRYLTIYKEREGHCRVPAKHKENGFRLGGWVVGQRQKQETLSKARRQQLDELGFVWKPFEMDWAEGIRYLTLYKEREGHCRISPTHKENGFRLGQWVENRRHNKHLLSEARRQQLDDLGFDWDPVQTDWEEGIRYLTMYKEREGHCRVPRLHKENGFRLGQWVGVRRRVSLSAPRRQQLDELGFVWDPLQTDWVEGFRYLKIYKEREGHCRVPATHKENNYPLGFWVVRQRQSKDQETLPEARQRQLDELGFIWDPREADWAESFRYLTIYKEREGHCRVPPKHMENGFLLGSWVDRQRQSKETLSEARRRQLDGLGFVWDQVRRDGPRTDWTEGFVRRDGFRTDWTEGFGYLTMYKEREGHCRVPPKHMENGFSLGQWVRVQRRNADTLSAPLRQQLDELGFVWDPYETDWTEGLRYLTIYKEREGHCRVPQKHVENGFRLGQWVGNRRQKKQTLSEARQRQLDELGFVLDPLETDWAEGCRYLTIYKKREGHCRVPALHKENGFHLGQWVRVQRRNAGTLSAPLRQQLDELGFVWDPLETDWAEGLRYLTIYKEREGHCRVFPKHVENGFRLGQWVGNWRQKKEILSKARRRQLDEVGFDWEPLETDWAEGLRYLTIYMKREGHSRVPPKHIENGFRLGQWVGNRRRSQESLPEARRDQLDELGFVWSKK
jgi:hypothetical protein